MISVVLRKAITGFMLAHIGKCDGFLFYIGFCDGFFGKPVTFQSLAGVSKVRRVFRLSIGEVPQASKMIGFAA